MIALVYGKIIELLRRMKWSVGMLITLIATEYFISVRLAEICIIFMVYTSTKTLAKLYILAKICSLAESRDLARIRILTEVHLPASPGAFLVHFGEMFVKGCLLLHGPGTCR